MITLGITGGIGSGKSYICQIFERLGVPIYDCDSKAKSLYSTHAGLKADMIALFGERLYQTETGELDRAYLAGLIFSDRTLLEKVNALVHPVVRADIDEWKAQRQSEGYAAVVLESALLLSSPALLDRVDKKIVVTAPLSLSLERAVLRDHSSREDIERRLKAQMPQEDMLLQSEYRINNDEEQHLLPQIYQIVHHLGLSI